MCTSTHNDQKVKILQCSNVHLKSNFDKDHKIEVYF